MNDQGEIILKDEYNNALEEIRKNKALGVNNIPIELIQNSAKIVKKELFKLVKNIHESNHP